MRPSSIPALLALACLCLPVVSCQRNPAAAAESPPANPPPASQPAPVAERVPASSPALAFPATFPPATPGPVKHILFITDDGLHGWMQHENTAGAILFAKRLAKAVPGCTATVLRDQFPSPAELDQADAVVLFCSGTEHHPLNQPETRAALEKAMLSGKGLTAIHWALEAGTTEGTAFLNTHLGGSFELNYSVNPMWLAKFTGIPEHEVTRGVSPFSIYDEFYFNIRFPELPGQRATILEAIPPKRVVLLPQDGPRSNNPAVRASSGKPHATAWSYIRPDGGRSVGFTGGHFHWDWKHDDYRRVLLNAIAWSARIPIPETGIPDTTPTDAELLEHQDSPPEPNWKPMPGQPPLAP